LWRAFAEDALPQAAAFARAGGHAVVWVHGRRSRAAWLLLPCDRRGQARPLSRWVMLMFGRRTYGLVRSRPAQGVGLLRVPRRFEPDVVTWCDRDAGWRGATRQLTLDCTSCGACCRGCRPVLRPSDLARWRAAGRADLAGRAFTRRSAGVVFLRLRETDNACVHLDGARCTIYPLRPFVCRLFPVGCEGCLEARRQTFGIDDRAAAP
jgi:hypothetical protein